MKVRVPQPSQGVGVIETVKTMIISYLVPIISNFPSSSLIQIVFFLYLFNYLNIFIYFY